MEKHILFAETALVRELRRMYRNSLYYFADTMTETEITTLESRQVLLKKFIDESKIKIPINDTDVSEHFVVSGESHLCECGGKLVLTKFTHAVKVKDDDSTVLILLEECGYVRDTGFAVLNTTETKELEVIDNVNELGVKDYNANVPFINVFEYIGIKQPEQRFTLHCEDCGTKYSYKTSISFSGFLSFEIGEAIERQEVEVVGEEAV